LNLPNLAFVSGVHGGPDGAVEVPGELRHVRKRTLNSEHVRRVDPGQNPDFEGLGPVLGAPDVGGADPEELPLAER
jgi:hypothetical protein